MSNPLDPEVMSPAERLEEAASLLARGVLRRRLSPTLHSYGDGARTADLSTIALAKVDGRKPALSGVEGKPLDVLREPRDECVGPQSEGRDT